MLIISAVLFLALLGRVEPFKITLKHPVSQPEIVAPPQAAPPAIVQPYYQQQQQTLVGSEPAGVKGAPIEQRPVATLARQPFPPPSPLFSLPPSQTLAYVIIRPLQPQYQYLEPARSYSKSVFSTSQSLAAPIQQEAVQQEPIRQQTYATKGGEQEQQQVIEQQLTKGAPEVIKQENIQEVREQPALQQSAPIVLVPVTAALRGTGKFNRLRSSLDKFAATAKSKLTLGSSYQVTGEEVVQQQQQAPLAHPLEQQKQQLAQDIALTQQEQETIRDTEQQEQHSFEPKQQQLEDSSKGQVVQQAELKEEKGLSKQQQEEIVNESSGEFRREQTRLGGKQFGQKSAQVDTKYAASKNY